MRINFAVYVSFPGPYPVVRFFPTQEAADDFDEASVEGGDISMMAIEVDDQGQLMVPVGFGLKKRRDGVLYNEDGEPRDYGFKPGPPLVGQVGRATGYSRS